MAKSKLIRVGATAYAVNLNGRRIDAGKVVAAPRANDWAPYYELRSSVRGVTFYQPRDTVHATMPAALVAAAEERIRYADATAKRAARALKLAEKAANYTLEQFQPKVRP